jgi:hypothetical protein
MTEITCEFGDENEALRDALAKSRALVAELEAERDRLRTRTHEIQERADQAEAECERLRGEVVKEQRNIEYWIKQLQAANIRADAAESESAGLRAVIAANGACDDCPVDGELTKVLGGNRRLRADNAGLRARLEGVRNDLLRATSNPAGVHLKSLDSALRASIAALAEIDRLAAVVEIARELLKWHDEELPKIDGHLTTAQVRAGHSFEGEWLPCGDIVDRLRAALAATPAPAKCDHGPPFKTGRQLMEERRQRSIDATAPAKCETCEAIRKACRDIRRNCDIDSTDFEEALCEIEAQLEPACAACEVKDTTGSDYDREHTCAALTAAPATAKCETCDGTGQIKKHIARERDMDPTRWRIEACPDCAPAKCCDEPFGDWRCQLEAGHDSDHKSSAGPTNVTWPNRLRGLTATHAPCETHCPSCGPDVALDEDLCCASCGAPATLADLAESYAAPCEAVKCLRSTCPHYITEGPGAGSCTAPGGEQPAKCETCERVRPVVTRIIDLLDHHLGDTDLRDEPIDELEQPDAAAMQAAVALRAILDK